MKSMKTLLKQRRHALLKQSQLQAKQPSNSKVRPLKAASTTTKHNIAPKSADTGVLKERFHQPKRPPPNDEGPCPVKVSSSSIAPTATKKPRNERDWDYYISELKAYKQQHGTVNVPASCKEYPELAHWVSNIRYRKEKTLSDDRKAQLENLGFRWKGVSVPLELTQQQRQNFTAGWDAMFSQLQEYKRLHGNCLVPQYATSSLGHWVKNQRAQYHNGTIEQDRQAKLESLGFVWRLRRLLKKPEYPKLEGLWQERYNELRAFQEEHGHCWITEASNQALQGWVNKQRTLFNQGLIRHDRKEKLDDIGFCWNPSGRPSVMKKAVKLRESFGSSK